MPLRALNVGLWVVMVLGVALLALSRSPGAMPLRALKFAMLTVAMLGVALLAVGVAL